MARLSKSNREKAYFESFCNHFTIPPGRIEYGDKPDIIIFGNRNIGIELTNLYHQSGKSQDSEQVQRVRREKVVSDAYKMHVAKGGKQIELSFCFDKSKPIRNTTHTTNRIIEIAQSLENHPGGIVREHLLETAPEIFSIYVNPKEYHDAQWRITQVHDGETLNKPNLVKRIREKEEASKDYKPCDENWLLLIVEFFDPAQDQEIETIPLGGISSTIFDKIIIFRTIHNHTVEIPLQKRDSQS